MKRVRTEKRREELLEELASFDLPPACAHLWVVYTRLRQRKGSNGFGANPIEWPDIHAFMMASRYPLAPWEVEAIEDVDNAYMAEMARAMSAHAKSPPSPQK